MIGYSQSIYGGTCKVKQGVHYILSISLMSLLLGKLRVVPSAPQRFAVQSVKAGKTVKSALGQEYVLKSEPMADLLCLELQGLLQTGQSVAKAVTRALHIAATDSGKRECITNLSRFYHTDTCLFRDTDGLKEVPEWDKCVQLFTNCTKITPKVSYNLLSSSRDNKQDQITTILREHDGWQLAALELSAQHCKSFIIPLLVHRGLLCPQEAANCALLEQTKQSVRWGDLEEHRLERARLLMNIYLSKLMVVA